MTVMPKDIRETFAAALMVLERVYREYDYSFLNDPLAGYELRTQHLHDVAIARVWLHSR